jgi:hypothetical protein
MTLRFYRGDTARFTITVVRSGAAVNLTGAALLMHARRRASDAAPLLTKSFTVLVAAAGTAEVTFLPADTVAFTATERLVYDVQLTESNGDVSTVTSGTLFVVEDVTR